MSCREGAGEVEHAGGQDGSRAQGKGSRWKGRAGAGEGEHGGGNEGAGPRGDILGLVTFFCLTTKCKAVKRYCHFQ